MKKALAFCTGLAMLLLAASCSGEKNSGAGRPRVITTGGSMPDSTIWYDAEIGTRQRSYKKELQGNWNISVMRRQQKAIPEKLNGAVIGFGPDSAFTGKASCNELGGVYILKGTSIKFSKIVASKNSCADIDRETEFLKLLERTVSAYSVSDEKLLLRDGASNIVFECERLH
jgi:heat shock protein HslJ